MGLTYTALSRARKFENLAFDPMPSVERIKRVFNLPTFTKRLEEDVRLKKLQDQTEREAETKLREKLTLKTLPLTTLMMTWTLMLK